MSENRISFEQSLALLGEIVTKLESGETSLEESMDLFQKGMESVKNCREALDSAEKRLKTLNEYEEENGDA